MNGAGKVVCIGLNKTGTKTLKSYFVSWGLRNRSFDKDAFDLYRAGRTDEVLQSMEGFDTFEDWPWPLLYREIDARYPGARFILTTRISPERWFRSLCNMAVRMGPLNDFERHVYGYAMPHGRGGQHKKIYEAHNSAVREHFRDRPGKLLELCWEAGDGAGKLAEFLGLPEPAGPPRHANKSPRAYSGDSLALAWANLVIYQARWYGREWSRRIVGGVRRRLGDALGARPAQP